MGRRYGVGAYQYEAVEHWPAVNVGGVAADIACDSAGRVYVAVRDYAPAGAPPPIIWPGTGHVTVLDRDGRFLATWDHPFSSPHGIWINEADEVFVADTGVHRVTRHAPSGELLLALDSRGIPGEPFNMPTRAKQAPNGDLFVSDGYGQNRVHRFSPTGEHILSWGSGAPVFVQKLTNQPVISDPCTGPGEFNLPHDVVVDRDGRVIVMDRENDRWQAFTMDGAFLSMCEGVTRPNDVTIDADGILHIGSRDGVEIRRPDGTLVGRWGEHGSEPGQFARGVHGIWLDAEGSLYAAEVNVYDAIHKFVRA